MGTKMTQTEFHRIVSALYIRASSLPMLTLARTQKSRKAQTRQPKCPHVAHGLNVSVPPQAQGTHLRPRRGVTE